MPARVPRPPSGLGPSGRALWKKVHTAAALRDDEVRVLYDACRSADEVDVMTEALAAAPSVVVLGSAGQQRAHPLIAEVRAHRLLLARLLAQLALPDDDSSDAAARQTGQRSQKAREAAHARWSR